MQDFYFQALGILSVYFILGAAGILFYLKKNGGEHKKELWTKYRVYLCLVLVLHSIFCFGGFLSEIVLFSLLVKGVHEVRKIWVRSQWEWWFFITLMALIGFAIVICHSLSVTPILYICVVAFDGFSQIVGQLIGRTRIFPKVSPNKTLEGLIGGSIAVFITCNLVMPKDNLEFEFFDLFNERFYQLVFPLLIISGSVLGDWMASLIKRRNGVKDFSNLIPGHGGILDRFDAFFFVLLLMAVFSTPFLIVLAMAI